MLVKNPSTPYNAYHICFILFVLHLIYVNEVNGNSYQLLKSDSDCCDETFNIKSEFQPEGYLKTPPIYDELGSAKNQNAKKNVECLYKFYGKPNERIQLFYEDFDLYYPYDIKKFNKIDCRYADSICLKFYESDPSATTQAPIAKNNKVNDFKFKNKLNKNKNSEIISLENYQYDMCNCINVTFIPRQIMSASNFIQVRFKTVSRQPVADSKASTAVAISTPAYRGYLIRYKFITDYGINTKDGGKLDPNGGCKIYYYSSDKKDGYFSSPNYPGLYPRDIECHYYFVGAKDQKVQITFHTFDVEGVDQCTAETKSDYVELSNFQNRDRYFSRFCGANKPFSVLSDSSFFHVTFFSNNLFDGKGFQASFHFINSYTKESNKEKPLPNQSLESSGTTLSPSILLTVLVAISLLF